MRVKDRLVLFQKLAEGDWTPPPATTRFANVRIQKCVSCFILPRQARQRNPRSPTFHTVCLIYAPPGAQRDVTSSAENMEHAIVRASNEAIVRHDGDREKVGIGRDRRRADSRFRGPRA